MEKISSFITELFKRFGLQSPRYFQVWQTIGLVCTAIGFIPDALKYFEITPSLPVDRALGWAVKAAGAVMWLMAKQPVTDPDDPQRKTSAGNLKSVDKEEALPFTAKKKPRLKRA